MTFIYDVLGIPFGFVLRLIYNLVNNYGVALIIFTFFSRLLMLPSSISQQKGAAKTQRLQSKVRKIQQKYAGDQKKIQEETQALYAREGQNPMSAGCGPTLISFIILFGIIGAVYSPLRYIVGIDKSVIDESLTPLVKVISGKSALGRQTELLAIAGMGRYSSLFGAVLGADRCEEVANFNFNFLGLQLGLTPTEAGDRVYWIVPILSGVSAFASSFIMQARQKKNNPAMGKNPMMGCMTFGMPLFSLYIAFQFPVGIGIYWTVSNIFALVQTLILSYTHNPQKMLARVLVEETIQRRSREANLKRVAEMKNKS